MKPPSVIAKGTEMQCSKCKNSIGTFNRDVSMGEKSDTEQLDFTKGNEYKNGDKVQCKVCASTLFKFMWPDGAVSWCDMAQKAI